MISQTWQQALSEMLTSPLALLSMLELDPNTVPWQRDEAFPVRVSKSFIARMKKGDPRDPLLAQVLSISAESQLDNSFTKDPLAESAFNPVPGLLHKYRSKVLITFASSCAIHCRYCFRRHFPYQENNPGRKGWSKMLDYIEQHPEVIEVILSGGDPLMAQDDVIKQFLNELDRLSHVKLLRIHTRLPVVIPQRINESLINILASSRFEVVFVYHINHPNELIPEIKEGVLRLKQHNITVLNQSVLLKDVNDNADCLKQLSLDLFANGILPYYINLLDPIQGAKHFSVDFKQAQSLQQTMRATLPGYLVPKFVREIPHNESKIPIDLIKN